MTVEKPLEIELKYTVAERTIGERLLNADTLAGFRAVGAPRPTQHEDRYIDSADSALARAGYAARLRTASNGTVVTVKSTEEGDGSLHRREELEGPADRTPAAAGWPASAARSLILELCGDAPLVELVTIRQFRRKRDLELLDEDAAIELSLDEVDVVSHGRVVERFLELELELTRGPIAALAPLQALLDGHHGLSAAPGSKLARALQAARPAPSRTAARPRTAEQVALRAGPASKTPLAEPGATPEPEPEPPAVAETPIEASAPATAETTASDEAVPDRQTTALAAAEAPAAGAPPENEAPPKAETPTAEAAERQDGSAETDHPRTREPKTRPQPPSEDGPVEGAVIDLDALDDTPELIEEAQAVPAPILGTPTNVELVGTIPVGKSPGIAADDLHAEAGRKVFRFHLARMLAREEGTREGVDLEELHAMRVSTRRMRAAWRVFGDGFRPDRTAKFKRRLRTIAARLGTVRDLDVLIEATVTFAAALPGGEHDGLDPLIDSWREQRDAGRQLLVHELDSSGYRRFVEEYSEFVLTPGMHAIHVDPTSPHRVRDTAGSRIWNSYEQVRAYESVLKWADVPTLHMLRIEAKRLRYTLEFVREALGPEAPALISRVVALQDHLGAMNDAEIGAHMARAYLVEHAGDLTDTQSSAISRYLVAREREVTRLRRTVGVPWRSVAGLTFRRALGRTIATL